MTQVEFDTAVITLEHNGRASIRTDYEERVFVSAYQAMRQRLNIPDNQDGKVRAIQNWLNSCAVWIGGNGDCSNRLLKVWINQTGVIAPTRSTANNKSARRRAGSGKAGQDIGNEPLDRVRKRRDKMRWCGRAARISLDVSCKLLR